MYVIFVKQNEAGEFVMSCFHKDQEEQEKMMHRLDIDKQVKEWQETHSGNPPTFVTITGLL